MKMTIEPYSNRWEQLANEQARSYAPEIYPCVKCGYPVISGYCCNFCNNENPRGNSPKAAPAKEVVMCEHAISGKCTRNLFNHCKPHVRNGDCLEACRAGIAKHCTPVAPANVCPLPKIQCSGEEAPVGTFACPPSCRAKEVEK
jgi:hypothetical protein